MDGNPNSAHTEHSSSIDPGYFTSNVDLNSTEKALADPRDAGWRGVLALESNMPFSGIMPAVHAASSPLLSLPHSRPDTPVSAIWTDDIPHDVTNDNDTLGNHWAVNTYSSSTDSVAQEQNHASDPGSKGPTRVSLLVTQPLLGPESSSSSQQYSRIGETHSPLGTSFVPNPFASTLARDAMLAFAHNIYNGAATSPGSSFAGGRAAGMMQMPFFVPMLLRQSQAGITSTPLTTDSHDGENPQQRHHIFSTQLIPLLNSLRTLHPTHLPTLLLLGCVYYSLGDYETSLRLNHELLRMDGNYVEAMSNIGTTLRALGRSSEGERWWNKAVHLRPAYWDAVDNLIGALSHDSYVQGNDPLALIDMWHQPTVAAFHFHSEPSRIPGVARYQDALEVCIFVQSRLLAPDNRPLVPIPINQIHRLQNILYTTGNLRHLIGHNKRGARHSTESGSADHIKAFEVVLRPFMISSPSLVRTPEEANHNHSTRDCILAVCIAGLLAGTSPASVHVNEIARCIGYPHGVDTLYELMNQGRLNLLEAVHQAGGRIIQLLLSIGGGTLPTVLLLPDQLVQLHNMIFQLSRGVVPALCCPPSPPSPGSISSPSGYDDYHHLPCPGVDNAVIQQTHHMTSTVLLTLAQLCQDAHGSDNFSFLGANVGTGILDQHSIPISTSLALLFYYLSLSLTPSPSTCNNLGIVLATVTASITVTNPVGQHVVLNGRELAKAYYSQGLSIDSEHPHLLTNLGSLLKDAGSIHDAIQMYAKALQFKPDFDIALANMGNAVKDLGRTADAIPYYRRAVLIRPDFPEAVSGLVNSLSAVCDWRPPGKDFDGLHPPREGNMHARLDMMTRLIAICEEQLQDVYRHGIGIVASYGSLDRWIDMIQTSIGIVLDSSRRDRWLKRIRPFYTGFDRSVSRVYEIGVVTRLIEYLTRHVQRRWYIDMYGTVTRAATSHTTTNISCEDIASRYRRPTLPGSLPFTPAPSILPFHTFTYPLSARTIRLVAHRNALRVSHMALSQTWLPSHVYPPPAPSPCINIGYVSSDLNNHPLAHLMQSAFSLHDRFRFNVFIYALAPSDGSRHRTQIEAVAQHFVDVSGWTTQHITEKIVSDDIQILVNLNGYTKGARNDIFAARPAPVQISMMGFAGTLAAGWCDYIVTDLTASPRTSSALERWIMRSEGPTLQESLDSSTWADLDVNPEEESQDWMYTERFIYMPHTFFVTDHKQSVMEESDDPNAGIEPPSPESLWIKEEVRRAQVRREVFPDLPPSTIIFANFNQLYKIDPTRFALWLRILARVPNSILWLLRFPAAGEAHLMRTAYEWAGAEIAGRLRFTDVATKELHLRRVRVADLFLDSSECNAHTVAADVLWGGTPILTWPMHHLKMSSRVGASIAYATGFGSNMVVHSAEEYEARAVDFGLGLRYTIAFEPEVQDLLMRGSGALMDLRRNLFEHRNKMPLFDTARWTRNIEKGYEEAWRRWVFGIEFASDDVEGIDGTDRGAIYVTDQGPFFPSE